MSNKLIEEIKRSRDTLLFLQEMGVADIPLTPEIARFLGRKESGPKKAERPQAISVEKSKSSKPFPALGFVMNGDSNPVLEEISSDIDGCTRCALHQHRSTIVTGQGERKHAF